jgi:hypothetical protein
MNAMAVPPPAWARIGAPEIQSFARRYLRQGLLLSSLCHFLLLAAFLVAVSRHREDGRITFSHAVIVDPAPPPPVIVPPAVSQAPITPQGTDGIFEPVAVTPPEIDLPSDPFAGASQDRVATSAGGIRTSGSGTEGPPGDAPEPDEHQPQVYDEPPVAVERPMPGYPDWVEIPIEFKL